MQKELLEVWEQVKKYFNEDLRKNTVLQIRRQTCRPTDSYLYMVSAKKDDGTYAVWTCWNDSIKSLNSGHYDLPSEEFCEKLMDEFYYSEDSN